METDMSPPSLDGVASVGGVVGGLVTDDREAPLPAAEVTSGTTSCAATIDLAGAARTEWGVLVIGAGPAGALAARQSALLGLKTLLVDKSPFPRAKFAAAASVDSAGMSSSASDWDIS
jgi:threonine dehydrogenase-like Zn-dependent dehydrogenase